MMSTSQFQSQLDFEQSSVDRAYRVLDEKRELYRRRQREAAATGAWGSHQARTERDAISSHYGDEAARLEQVNDNLVFGRLTTTENLNHYIGRVGLVNDQDQRVLLDWRAPAALPFYQATAVEPLGIIMRRHIITKQRQVVGLEDELLDQDAALNNSNLQGEGALLASLSAARDSHMSDIVATIQAEQDRVIRADDNGIVVVQGGPGTGKTAVALHRAAYLLYAQHERLARSGVLIVGPTSTFLRYIEKVLPSLGETGVVATTPDSLFPGIVAEGEDPVQVSRLKGDIRWAEAISKAISLMQRVPPAPIQVEINHKKVSITPKLVREAQSKAKRRSRYHNEAWSTFATEIMNSLADQMVATIPEPTPEDYAWAMADIRANDKARKQINLLWLPCTAPELISRLFADPQRLRQTAPWLSDDEVIQLLKPLGSPWTGADVALLDEAAELLGEHPAISRIRDRENAQAAETLSQAEAVINSGFDQSGIVSASVLAEHMQVQDKPDLGTLAARDRSWTYGHIVVDEAQELSPMMWRALLRRCPARSFTVVGDLDQQRVDHGQRSWHEVLGPAAQYLHSEVVLTTSYRTPATITQAAEDVMTAHQRQVVYPVQAVRDVDNCLILHGLISSSQAVPATAQEISSAVDSLTESAGKTSGRIAVIVPSEADVEAISNEVDNLDKRVWITTAARTKGLEFDIVIIMDPVTIGEASLGDLYVAMTRPTKELRIIEVERHLAGLRKH